MGLIVENGQVWWGPGEFECLYYKVNVISDGFADCYTSSDENDRKWSKDTKPMPLEDFGTSLKLNLEWTLDTRFETSDFVEVALWHQRDAIKTLLHERKLIEHRLTEIAYDLGRLGHAEPKTEEAPEAPQIQHRPPPDNIVDLIVHIIEQHSEGLKAKDIKACVRESRPDIASTAVDEMLSALRERGRIRTTGTRMKYLYLPAIDPKTIDSPFIPEAIKATLTKWPAGMELNELVDHVQQMRPLTKPESVRMEVSRMHENRVIVTDGPGHKVFRLATRA